MSRSRAVLWPIALSFILAMLVTSVSAAWAETAPGVGWEKTYNINGSDTGWSMCQTSDGGYIMVGTASGQVCLAKVDSGGSMLWNDTYGMGQSSDGYSVALTGDGGYIVTGSVTTGSSCQVLLMKVDQNGTQLWNKTYGDTGSADTSCGGYSVRQASDGGYIIAAQYPDSMTNHEGLFLIRTDASGNIQSQVMVGNDGDITSPTVEQTSDGGYIIAATIHILVNSPGYDIYLIKLDSSGNTQWEKNIGSGSQYCGNDGSVLQASDGGYLVAGESGGAYLVKTDSSGNVLWSEQYNNSSGANSVREASDGGYILAGSYSGLPLVIKVDSSGVETWRESGSSPGVARVAVQTADGGYAAFGTSNGEFYLLKLSPPASSGTDMSEIGNSNGLFSGFGNMFNFTSPTFGGSQGSSTQSNDLGTLFGGSLFSMPSTGVMNTGTDMGYTNPSSSDGISLNNNFFSVSPFNFDAWPFG